MIDVGWVVIVLFGVGTGAIAFGVGWRRDGRDYLRRLPITAGVVIGGMLVLTLTPGGHVAKLAAYGAYAVVVIAAAVVARRLGFAVWGWRD